MFFISICFDFEINETVVDRTLFFKSNMFQSRFVVLLIELNGVAATQINKLDVC